MPDPGPAPGKGGRPPELKMFTFFKYSLFKNVSIPGPGPAPGMKEGGRPPELKMLTC